MQSGGEIYQNINSLAEGTFVLVAAEGYKKEYQAPPQPVFTDADLEKQIHDALTQKWRSTTVIRKVILTEKEWRVETNALGVPVHKVLRVYAITNPNPEKYTPEEASHCYATPYEVKREYAGNGQYSTQVKWHSSGGRDNYEVECQ